MNLQLLKSHWVFSIKDIIIAGGFFRDNFLGVPVKDIDIYCTPGNKEDVLRQLNHRIAENITRDRESTKDFLINEKNQYGQSYVTSVNTYRTWQGELVD